MANDKNDANQQLLNLCDTSRRPRDQADRFFIDLLTYGRVTHGLVVFVSLPRLARTWRMKTKANFRSQGFGTSTSARMQLLPGMLSGSFNVETHAKTHSPVARTVAEFERATLEDPERAYGATIDALRSCFSVPLTPDEKLAALDDIKAEIIKAEFPTHEHEMKCIEAKHSLLSIVLADDEPLPIDAIRGVLEALRRHHGEDGKLPQFNQVDGVTDQQFLDVLQAHIDGGDAPTIARKVGVSPELVGAVLENIA
jgi:hypothetical protein